MLVNDKAQKSSCFENLSPIQQYELEAYVTGLIQGALAYEDTFTVPDLVGGKFKRWGITPLEYIYKYHYAKKVKEVAKEKIKGRISLEEMKKLADEIGELAAVEAGKDVGRIIKYIMSIDKARCYKVVGTEQRRYPINVYALVDIKLESEDEDPIIWGLNFD